MNGNLTESVQVLFQKTHVEALVNNRRQADKWLTYKKDLSEVSERLNFFLRDLNVPVMVPVGNKALFRGKLVHTNDVMISLGDDYFVKGSVEQALEVAARRLVKCDEMLSELDRERGLLETRARVRTDTDLFPSSDIVEEFDQHQEDRWKIEHKKKVKEYREKLTEMRERDPSEIKTDEDLWKRLELLEMEEELNDELDRLGSDRSSSELESSSDSSDESTSEPVSSSIDHPGLNKTPRSSIIKQTSKPPVTEPLMEDSSDSYITINFKHSSHEPLIKQHKDTIESPRDIYFKFSDAIDKKKKKLVRRVSFADNPEIKTFRSEPGEFVNDPVVLRDNRELEEQPVAFGDVVERTAPFQDKPEQNRPVSKFKSSRIKHNTK